MWCLRSPSGVSPLTTQGVLRAGLGGRGRGRGRGGGGGGLASGAQSAWLGSLRTRHVAWGDVVPVSWEGVELPARSAKESTTRRGTIQPRLPRAGSEGSVLFFSAGMSGRYRKGYGGAGFPRESTPKDPTHSKSRSQLCGYGDGWIHGRASPGEELRLFRNL